MRLYCFLILFLITITLQAQTAGIRYVNPLGWLYIPDNTSYKPKPFYTLYLNGHVPITKNGDGISIRAGYSNISVDDTRFTGLSNLPDSLGETEYYDRNITFGLGYIKFLKLRREQYFAFIETGVNANWVNSNQILNFKAYGFNYTYIKTYHTKELLLSFDLSVGLHLQLIGNLYYTPSVGAHFIKPPDTFWQEGLRLGYLDHVRAGKKFYYNMNILSFKYVF